MILLLLLLNTCFAHEYCAVYDVGHSVYVTNQASTINNAIQDLGRDRTPDPIHAYSKANQLEVNTMELSVQQLQIQAQTRFQDTYGKTRIHQLRVTNEMEETAKKYLDIVVGADPIGCFTRSNYEWLTGTNLVTKQPLTQFEHAVAFMGVVTLGGEAPVLKALQFAKSALHLFNVHQMEMAMAYGRLIIKTSAGHIYTLIHTVGQIKLSEGVKAFKTDAHVSFRKNQVYARVVPKFAIPKILSGESGLSLEPQAFIALANEIKYYKHEKYMLAEKLSLYKDSSLKELRDLQDHSLIKFKIIQFEEMTVDPSKYPGHITGGETLGGLKEFIIPSDAINKGLIDITTIEIEELFL